MKKKKDSGCQLYYLPKTRICRFFPVSIFAAETYAYSKWKETCNCVYITTLAAASCTPSINITWISISNVYYVVPIHKGLYAFCIYSCWHKSPSRDERCRLGQGVISRTERAWIRANRNEAERNSLPINVGPRRWFSHVNGIFDLHSLRFLYRFSDKPKKQQGLLCTDSTEPEREKNKSYFCFLILLLLMYLLHTLSCFNFRLLLYTYTKWKGINHSLCTGAGSHRHTQSSANFMCVVSGRGLGGFSLRPTDGERWRRNPPNAVFDSPKKISKRAE